MDIYTQLGQDEQDGEQRSQRVPLDAGLRHRHYIRPGYVLDSLSPNSPAGLKLRIPSRTR